MARMSIDDKLLRDPRAIRLGRLFGWRRQEAVGRLLDVYALAYDRERDVIAEADIDIAAEQEGFAVRMIEVDLAEQARSGIRIKGAADRILYLQGKHEAARAGGIKSGETRRKKAEQRTKHSFDFGEARANPPDTVPDPADLPDPAPDPVITPPSKRARRLEASWAPERGPANARAEQDAKARGVDLRVELAKLHDWALANGAKRADWDAVWRNWTRNAKPNGSFRPAQGPTLLQGLLLDIDELQRKEDLAKGDAS